MDIDREDMQATMDNFFATHEYVKARDWRKMPELGEAEDDPAPPEPKPVMDHRNVPPPVSRR